MYAKKSLGQNFLMHARIAERIADAANIDNATVLEIGPGTGMLTRPLLAHARKVIAVEADAELVRALEETFQDEIKNKGLELITGDIRAFDPSSIPGSYALVANIPYYLTGDLIRTFLEAAHAPSSITLLVQKEVAVRIARSKKESILSVAVKTYGIPTYLFTVPRGAFKPAPTVDSAVLSIANLHTPFTGKAEEKRFFDVLHAGFAHKRKLLRRNLEVRAEKARIEEVFSRLGIPENARAEDVGAPLWQKLARELNPKA